MASSVVSLGGGGSGSHTPASEGALRSIEEMSITMEELARRIQVLENLIFFIRHVEPEKPRAPMIAYADGVHWIPPQPTVPPLPGAPTVVVDDTWDGGSGAVVIPGEEPPVPGPIPGYYEYREDGQWHKL